MNFFKTKPRSPQDLVRGLRELGLGRVAEGANGLPERGYVTQRFGCREGPT